MKRLPVGTAADALALAGQRGSWSPAVVTEWTLGLIDLAAGRPAEAAGRLFAITGSEYPDRNPVIALEAMPDAVEAGIRAGLHDQAAAWLETFRGLVTAGPAQPRLALLARCDALLEARDPDQAFGEAIALSPGLPPLQRARTELLYGEWLRWERRTDSRVHLRAALEPFHGAGPRSRRTRGTPRPVPWPPGPAPGRSLPARAARPTPPVRTDRGGRHPHDRTAPSYQ